MGCHSSFLMIRMTQLHWIFRKLIRQGYKRWIWEEDLSPGDGLGGYCSHLKMTDDSDCTEGWQEMERRRWTTKTFSVGFDTGTLTEWLKVHVNVWEHQQQWLGNGTGLAIEGDLCEVKFAVLVGHISRAMWQAVGKSTEASMAWWLHKEFLKQVLRNNSNRNEWESLDSKHWLDCALLYIIQHCKKII